MKAIMPRPCAQCGTVYEPADAQPSRKYCSRKCSTDAKRRGSVRTCVECGDEFYVNAAELKRRGGKYCSRACWRKNSRFSDEHYARLAEELSVSRRGAGNPAYKHGRNGNRARLKRFNLSLKGEDRCRVCGSQEFLNLHHVLPRSMYRAGRDEILNGLPLCGACHTSWHRRGKVTIYRDVFTDEEWAWISAQSLLGQNLQAWLDDRYPSRPVSLVGIEEARRRVTA